MWGVVELSSRKSNPHLGEVSCDECHLGSATTTGAGSNLVPALPYGNQIEHVPSHGHEAFYFASG